MRTLIYPQKFGSRGAKLLATALNTKRIRDVGRYRRRAGDSIINWGNTTIPSFGELQLNKTNAVSNSVDKVIAFRKMTDAEVKTVEWTTERSVAQAWLDAGSSVYARTLTRASGGRGIIIAEPGDRLPTAKLYTKAVVGDEYRVHVFNGEVIDYTKKVPLRDNALAKIKSHDNGWTFARNVEQRESTKTTAINAIKALGLDFGAVDIIMVPGSSGKNTWARVLEVNSSPGVEGRTLQNYVTAIRKYYAEN